MKRAAAAVALAVIACATPVLAAPPDMNECIAAFDKGQRARSDKKLRRAQTELLVCTHESCPAVLRADCAGVLERVQSELPTIVLAADDGNGRDLADVKVYAGDELLASRIDGRAIDQDPGTFALRFVHAGDKPVVVSATIREGEKNRVVRASFAAPVAERREPPPPPPAPPRSTTGWIVPSALALGGVGALAVAGISRLHFDSQVDDFRSANGCAPDCTQGQRDDLSKSLVTANVALALGGALLAGAALTWILFAPSSPRSGTGSARGLSW